MGNRSWEGFLAVGDAALRLGAPVVEFHTGRFAHVDGEQQVAELKRIASDTVFFASNVARLPNTSNFAIPGLAAETALIALDLDGVAVSSGSACSSCRGCRTTHSRWRSASNRWSARIKPARA